MENNEAFTVSLTISGAPPGLNASNTGIGTINDDDAAAAVELSILPNTVNEGAAATTIMVTATLPDDIKLSYDEVITLSVGQGGTAGLGKDYAVAPETEIRIVAGESSGTGTFVLTPIQDTSAEGDETIFVTGTAPSLTVNQTSLLLIDDDNAKTYHK